MEGPDVKNVLNDTEKNVVYEVLAYRALSREELIMAVRMFLSGKGVKKPKRNSRVTIVTVIGCNE